MIRLLAPAIIFLFLVGFLFVGLYKDPSLVPSPLIGKPVPTFAVSTLRDANKTITDKDLQGKIALINVWATWCPACKQEHATLVQLAKQVEIPIYGLNYKDDRASAIQWLRDYGDPYVLNIFDENGRIGIDFGVYGAPETFLIDAQGVIQHKLVGIMTPQVWQTQFVPLIDQLTSKVAQQ